jgi:glutamyl-tRNA reductase
MSFVLLGLNHQTAPVEVREQLAFDARELPAALGAMVDGRLIEEGLIISTCNRVELLALTSGDARAGLGRLREFLYNFKHCAAGCFDKHLYQHADVDAVRHVFRVASSLDSLVVGEPQILGQVKDAFQLAQESRTAGHALTRLMNRAFAVAKRVRNETGVASNAVSISFVAVELARKVFDTLRGTTVLLVGAGEMAELAARHLITHGASRILIANRTFDHAAELAAEMKGEAVRFEELGARLYEADIVICSTGAPHYLVGPDHVRRALTSRKHRPFFLIDISVPRNIDPAVSEIENAFVFDIDDLQAVAHANLKEREREARRAEEIVGAEAERFAAALAEGNVNKVIGVFRREIQDLAFAEFERSRKRLGDLSPAQEEALRVMLNAVVNRFTHPIIQKMRESEDGHSAYLDAFREFYHRDQQD